MSSLQVSSSLSTSFFQSESTSVQGSISDSGDSRSLAYSQQTQSVMKGSYESNIELETGKGEKYRVSMEAEFSMKFARSTKVAISDHGKSPLFGSRGLQSNTGESTDRSKTEPESTQESDAATNVNSGNSLFEDDSLVQQVYEDNLAFFDDFLERNGDELSKGNVNQFVELVKDRLPEGFGQASNELDGLNLLNNEDSNALANIRETVSEKFESFREAMIEKIENGDLRKPGDFNFTDLPGVESGQNSGRALSLRASLSVQTMQMTRLMVDEQVNGTDSISNEPTDENQSTNPSDEAESNTLNVQSLSRSLYKKSVSLFESSQSKNDELIESPFEDLRRDLEESVAAGIDSARDNLSDIEFLDSELSDQLGNVSSNLMNRLNEFVQDPEQQGSPNVTENSSSSDPSTSGESESASGTTNPRSPNAGDADSELEEASPAMTTDADDDRTAGTYSADGKSNRMERDELEPNENESTARPRPARQALEHASGNAIFA